jgi:hypothetical protein
MAKTMASYDSFMPANNPEVTDGLPKLDLNLWDHKTSIAINWTILFITSGVMPIVLYFALRYAAHLELGTGTVWMLRCVS